MSSVHLGSADDTGVRVDLRLSPQMPQVWGHLLELQRELPGTVRVVVLRGLTDLADCADPAVYQRACDWTSTPAFVSVAVLDGAARGPALDLAMGCDLRVVSTRALLSQPGPASIGGLVQALGYPVALDLAVTGRGVSGAEAYALGLAARLAPAEELDDELDRLVAQLLAPGRDLVRELKALLLGASNRGAPRQHDAQVEAIARLNSPDPDGAPPS